MNNSNVTFYHKISMLFLIMATLLNGQSLFAQSAAEKQKAMIINYIEAMNEGNETYLDEYLSDDYIYHGSNGDLNKEGFKQFHHAALTAFPDAVMNAEDILVDGDKTVTRWMLKATHEGDFNGMPASHKPVKITGIIISRFENGHVVEEWEEANMLGLLQQIGLLSLPERN